MKYSTQHLRFAILLCLLPGLASGALILAGEIGPLGVFVLGFAASVIFGGVYLSRSERIRKNLSLIFQKRPLSRRISQRSR